MRAFLGNNCAKGCLIYIFAFALLVVVSSMGLSGLSSRFGVAQIQGIKPDLSVPQAAQGLTILQSQPASVNQDALGGGLPPTTAGVHLRLPLLPRRARCLQLRPRHRSKDRAARSRAGRRSHFT